MSVSKTKKYLILIADILIIPALTLCERLTDSMLSRSNPCPWTLLGGKCVSCGGTHFVNSLLNGKIAEAFEHNPFLFFVTLVLAVSFVLLNLDWLFGLRFPKTVLSGIYSIPMLIVTLSLMLIFFFVRNVPVFIRIAELIFSVL